MKYIITVLFLVAFAFAQEMDTTFVVNEKGETVGIIHEKGTVPIIAPQQAAPAQVAAPAPAQVAQVPPPGMFEVDSTQYYQSMIDLYMNKGNKMRRAGKGMMLGGGLGAGLGAVLMVVGLAGADSDGDMDGDAAAAYLSGYLLVVGGATVFTVGIIVKSVGGGKLRKAERYNEKLVLHQMRRNMVNLQFTPTFNVENKALGGNLALTF